MNVYERIFKLWSAICKMIVDGARDPEKVAEVLQSIVNESAVVVKKYLEHLFTFKLGATDGKDTYETARKVFKAYLDPDFENWGIVFSGIAPEAEIAVDELVKDGKFTDFLENTVTELEKRHMLGSQFLKICADTSDKLRVEGYANFFVLTKGDKPVAKDLRNVFVAGVYVDGDGELIAFLFEFRDDHVWHSGCGHRVFSPQQ